MPVRYVLTERAFTALLGLSHRDHMSLLATFEQLCENPAGLATHLAVDWEGHLACAIRHGRFEIGYAVHAESDWLTIMMVRPRR